MFKVVQCDEGKKYCSKNLQEQEIYDTIGTYEDEAFILPDDVVVVDVDDVDPDIIDAMIDEFGIKTMYSHTDEGAHLYFKKPGRYKKANEGPSPLGFRIEHKHKQCVITHNGITRELYNVGTLEKLPFFLTIDEKYPNLEGIGDGDGRYDSMLSMNGYLGNRSNKRQIMQFINTYVLDEPMAGKQLNGILNSELTLPGGDDDEDIKSKQEKKKDVLDDLLEKFRPVRYNGTLYFWDYEDNRWETDINILTRLMYKQFFGFGVSTIDEYIKHVERLAYIYKGYEIFPIQFTNGYLYDGTWNHGVYPEFTPFMIDYPYLPNAPITKEMETFMNFITEENPELIQYIFEAFSQALEVEPDRRNKYPRIHTFLGEGGNGKGMLMRLLKQGIGKRNTSNVKLHKFNDKDQLIMLKGKLLNISEDENGGVLKDSMLAEIKNIAAADEITIRGIYEAAQDSLIFPALFVTSNHAFPTYEKGASVKRRFFWIEFNQELGGQEFLDDDFIKALHSTESMEWFMSQVVAGYFRVRKEGYSSCKVIDDFTAEYHSINNNIEEYTDDMQVEEFRGKKIADCYSFYESWAKGERKYAMPLGDFKLFICKKYRLEETVGKERQEAEDVDGNPYIKRVSVRKFKEKK